MLPQAHAGHYAIWVFYALPVLVVIAAIIKSRLSLRHSTNAPAAGGDDSEDSPGRESPESETGPAARAP